MVRNIIAVRESVKQAIGCLRFFFWGTNWLSPSRERPHVGDRPLCVEGMHKALMVATGLNYHGGTPTGRKKWEEQLGLILPHAVSSGLQLSLLGPYPSPLREKKKREKKALDKEIFLQHQIQASGPQTSLFWVKLTPFSQQEFCLILQQDQVCWPYL